MRNKAHILVVAHDQRWREFAAQALRDEGYSVHVCGDTQAALQDIADDGFDLIVVDALMADMLNTLATDPGHHRLLVVTAAQSVPEAILAYRRGALDYVSKAFDLAGWLATISTVLRKKPVQQSLPV